MTKQDARKKLTGPQRVVAALVGTLSLTLAGLAFAGMFTAVKTEMVPFFHSIAWIVPVGVDVGILALISAGILLEWLAMPMPALRYVAMTFMGASVWLNVSAAHGSATGAVGHAALPVLFIACIEAIRHAVRRTAGMANGTVRDGIPFARWILAFPSSFKMFRRMVLQRINSYPQAAALEVSRRHAIAQLRAMHGPQWRRVAPGDLVWMLEKGVSVADAITRVAELTGIPAPGPVVPVPVLGAGPGTGQDQDQDRSQDQTYVPPRRRGPRSQDQPMRSMDELQRQALDAIAQHKTKTGDRMNNKELARALRVSNELAGEIRRQIKDREEGAA